MKVDFNLKMDRLLLKAVEAIQDVDTLEEVLDLFLSAFLHVPHVRSADVLLFNKRKDLVRVASAAERAQDGERRIELKIEPHLMDSSVIHTSRRVHLPVINPVFAIPLFNYPDLQGVLRVQMSLAAIADKALVQDIYFAAQQLAMKIGGITLKSEKEAMDAELATLRAANKEAFRNVTSISKELYVITAISTKLNQTLDPGKALWKCTKKLREVFDASGIFIYTSKDGCSRLRPSIMDSEPCGSQPTLGIEPLGKLEKAFLQEVMSSSKPVAKTGIPYFCKTKLDGGEAQAILGVPLTSKDAGVGIMLVQRRESRPFTQNDIRLLSGVANIMGMAITNMKLYQKTEQKKQETTSLTNSIAKFHKTLNLKKTLVSVAEKGAEIIGGECDAYLFSETKVPVISVTLRKKGEEGKEIIRSKVFHRLEPEELKDAYHWLNGHPKSMLIKNIHHSNRLKPSIKDFFVNTKVRSFMAIPLVLARKRWGLLLFCRTSTEPSFTRHDLAVAETLAKVAAVAIQNANAHESSLEMSDFLEKKITERTAEIRQIQELQKQRVENRNDIIFRVNRNNRFVFVNKAMEDITGVSREVLYRRDMKAEDVVAEEDRQRIRGAFQEILKGKRDIIQDLEYRHIGPADENRVISLTVYPEYDVSGGILGLEGVGRDITKQKRLEAELEKAKDLAMLGEFSGAVAHQIRNPLGNILMGCKLLQRVLGLNHHEEINDGRRASESPPIQGDKQMLSRIFNDLSEGINNLNQIITELLGYTRSFRLRPSSQRIELIVEDTLLMMKDMIRQNRIHVETNFDTQLPAIPMDALLMAQVFQNTTHNAIQAMPHGGNLLLSSGFCAEDPDYAEISIRDTGVGIEPHEIEKVFRPFFTTKDSGIGLGLSICHRIVDAHGGCISIRNNKKKGAFVRIILPLRKTPSLQETRSW
jgi:PAS domain S-box-containing protein